MPRIATFIYSDNSQLSINNNSQVLTITNPMLIFKPTFIPSTFSFAVTIGILGADESTPHVLRYIFKKKDSEELIINTGDMQFPARNTDTDSAQVPHEYNGFLVNLDFRNVVLKSEGEYVSQVYLDTIHLGDFPIYVKGIETNG